MSGNQLYEFHQREIQDLQTAKAHTLRICSCLKGLQKDIACDDSSYADWSIILFLQHGNRESCLRSVEHLFAAVAHPIKIPSRLAFWRSSADEPHYNTIAESAHRAAWELDSAVRSTLCGIWQRGQASISSDDIGVAAQEIVQLHWQELRERLKPLADLDCDKLKLAVVKESSAAMERCRQSIVGGGTTISTEPHDVFIPTPLQAAILNALDGKAMKKQPLANAVCGGEGTRLYRKGGIKELQALGRVHHKDGVGYFRPDAPPVN